MGCLGTKQTCAPADSSCADANVDFVNTSCSSISESKLSSNPVVINSPSTYKYGVCGYCIIDLDILGGIFEELLCPLCSTNNLHLSECFVKKQGFTSCLQLECKCCYEKKFFTSQRAGRGYDVNKRMVYSMRACGTGFNGMEIFSQLMNCFNCFISVSMPCFP